jgi:hypothetical protein
MTDTIDDVAATEEQEPAEPLLDEQGVAEQLVAQARAKGIDLVDPTGRGAASWRRREVLVLTGL